MANTQVFTLGLGVSGETPLGAAFQALRQRIGLLRREADSTRLGRIIAEVIRLGLELDKVGRAGRTLAIDEAANHERQIECLNDEADRVQQLRTAYLRLGQVVAGLPSPRPLAVQGAWHPPMRLPSVASTPALKPSGKPVTPSTATAPAPRSAGDKAKVVAASAGWLAVGGIAAYKASRRLSPEERQRAAKAVNGKFGTGAVTAVLKGGEALLTGEDGRAKAKGVGAAVGELAGNLLGAAIGAAKGGATGKKRGEEYGSLFGAYLGEKLGGRVGEGLYDFFTDSTEHKGSQAEGSVVPQQAPQQPATALPDAPGATRQFEALTQGESLPSLGAALADVGQGATLAGQRLLALGNAAVPVTPAAQVAGAVPVTLSPVAGLIQSRVQQPSGSGVVAPSQPSGEASKSTYVTAEDAARSPLQRSSGPVDVVSSGLTGEAPKGAFSRMGAAARSLGKPAVLGAVAKGLDTFTSDKSDSDKAEGYGNALGGLVGTVVGGALGSIVPGLGTVVGSTVGGMVGEAVGGWVGKAWFGQEDGNTKPTAAKPAASEPAAPEAISQMPDTQNGGKPSVTTEPGKDSTEPASATEADATAVVEPRGVGAAMKVLAKPAVLNATRRGLETFTSDKSQSEKAEGYGSAVGGLVGTLVGGAIGSVVPVVGTTFGAALGGMVGDQLGGWLGKTWLGGKEQSAKAEAAAKAGGVTPVTSKDVLYPKAAPGDVVRSMSNQQASPQASPPTTVGATPTPPAPVYNQQFTFTSNMPVNVTNSFDDPATLAQLEAIARRQLEELMRQARSAQLADTPHIAL